MKPRWVVMSTTRQDIPGYGNLMLTQKRRLDRTRLWIHAARLAGPDWPHAFHYTLWDGPRLVNAGRDAGPLIAMAESGDLVWRHEQEDWPRPLPDIPRKT